MIVLQGGAHQKEHRFAERGRKPIPRGDDLADSGDDAT